MADSTLTTVYPEIYQAAPRSIYRLWLVLRLHVVGGRIVKRDAIRAAHSDLGYSRGYTNRLLSQGNGIFWRPGKNNFLYLQSPDKTALALDVHAISTIQYVPVEHITTGTQSFNACHGWALITAMSEGKPQTYSRAFLAQAIGVSKRTLNYWFKLEYGEIQRQYSRAPLGTKYFAPESGYTWYVCGCDEKHQRTRNVESMWRHIESAHNGSHDLAYEERQLPNLYTPHYTYGGTHRTYDKRRRPRAHLEKHWREITSRPCFCNREPCACRHHRLYTGNKEQAEYNLNRWGIIHDLDFINEEGAVIRVFRENSRSEIWNHQIKRG